VQHRFFVILVAIMAAVAGESVAQGIPPGVARDLAATCAGCHGAQGASVGGIPSLAGMDPRVLVDSLQEFRAGTRPGTVMPQLAKGYTDPQIEAIAAYYAAQRVRP